MFKNFFNRKKSTGQSKESTSKDSAFDAYLVQIVVNDFVDHALQGPYETKIDVSDLADCTDGLMQGLQKQGKLDEQQFKSGLHAECPKCGVRLTGEGILMVSMLKRFNNPAFGGGSAKTERIFRGLCANEGCDSTETILKWDG